MIEKVTTPKKIKVPRKLKKLVIDSVKRHAWNIGVSQYKGDILYMAEDVREGDGMINAMCVVNRRYLRATIQLYPIFIKSWKRDGDQYVEDTIAHEVAHIATQHFYDVASARYCDDGEMKDAWETVTEVIGALSSKLDKAMRP